MSGTELRRKRAAHGIPGHTVCARADTCRSRLSDVELERVPATLAELQRISTAIDEIISERQRITQVVEAHGLSLAGAGF